MNQFLKQIGLDTDLCEWQKVPN